MFLSLLFTVILFTGKELVPAIFKTKALVRLRRYPVSIGTQYNRLKQKGDIPQRGTQREKEYTCGGECNSSLTLKHIPI